MSQHLLAPVAVCLRVRSVAADSHVYAGISSSAACWGPARPAMQLLCSTAGLMMLCILVNLHSVELWQWLTSPRDGSP
jgi:hypothetical protein